MNGPLLEAFRHNSWATKELLAFCRDLPEEQLRQSATGTYADILGTLNHIVRADCRYARRFTAVPEWVTGSEEPVDIARLTERAEEIEPLWEKIFSEPFDEGRVLILDDGAYEATSGVIIAQALHHANAHREQVCAILTGLGTQPPDLQGWAWGEATGRGRERAAGS